MYIYFIRRTVPLLVLSGLLLSLSGLCNSVKLCYSPDKKYSAFLEDSNGNIMVNIFSRGKKEFSHRTVASTSMGGEISWHGNDLILDSGDIGKIKYQKFKGKWLQMVAEQYISPSGDDSVNIDWNSRKNMTVSLIFGKVNYAEDFDSNMESYFYIVTKFKVLRRENAIIWLSNDTIEMAVNGDQKVFFRKQSDETWQQVEKQMNGSWKIVSTPIIKMNQFYLNSALFSATENNLYDLVKYGADVNFRNPEGNTVLMEFCKRGNINFVKLLISCKAEVNAINPDNENAIFLCFSAVNNKFEIIDFLLNNTDINVNILNIYNKTPLDEALEIENSKIVNLLKQHGAKTAQELLIGK